jgi:hypothetical protein
VYGGKQRVEAKEKKLTEKHFGKNRERRYRNAQGAVLPQFRSTKQGRQWRKKLAAGTLTEGEWKIVPSKLRGVLRCAKTVADKAGNTARPQHHGDIFTIAISMHRLKRWLARKKKNTAPGVSGVRVDHLAAAPTRALRARARVLSMPYVAGCMYSAWAEETVNWVPKEDGNSDLGRRRPLMYNEVMRKISVGIKKAHGARSNSPQAEFGGSE